MNEGIIDFHAHAFPDELAPRAMKKLLEEAPDAKAFLDGTIKDLSDSMKRNHISRSVICCIATTPEQFTPIFNWCKKVRNCYCERSDMKHPEAKESIKLDFSTRFDKSELARNDDSKQDTERLIMFPSIHPADTKWKERIAQIKQEGFKGVKFHPYYQNFHLDEDRMLPIYEELEGNDLIAVSHTGYDIAFPKDTRADCRRILNVTKMFPKLKFVTTHLGAWQQWDDVERLLAGKHIYMELSWSLEYLAAEQARRIIVAHPEDCVLFGTDSPWTDQAKTLSLLKNLELPGHLEKRILRDNALELLGISN